MSQIALSIADVCRALSIGRTTAYELINGGELETLKLGRRTLVTVRSVEALFERSLGQAPREPLEQPSEALSTLDYPENVVPTRPPRK